MNDLDLGLDFFNDLDFGIDTVKEINANEEVKLVEETVTETTSSTTNIKSELSTLDIEALAISAQDKLMKISNELSEMFFEREDVIQNAMRSIAIGQSMLLLGPPGTGKVTI